MIKQRLAVMLAVQIALGLGPAKVQAEDNSYTSALTTDSASPIAESVVDERENNRVNTGPHVFADVTASGKWGTCPWSVSSDGVLTIGAGTGENIDLSFYVPWYSQRKNIKSVKLTGKVTLPQSVQYLFSGLSNLTTFDASNLDTSAVTNMSEMFSYCSNLATLDVSNWDTGKVTRMGYMFNDCSNITALNVSKWSTSAVTDMSSMFNKCSNLTTLDVSNWDTSAVIVGSFANGMSSLFSSSGLRKIKIGSGFVNSTKSTGVFPTPSKTISGKDSSGTWGLASETAVKQYTADELATLGQTAGALTGTWYAQRKERTFKSWNTKPDGSGTTYKPGDALPNQNLDLYAQWG